MVMEILQTLCDQKECAIECLYNSTVMGTLLQPILNLLRGTEVGTVYREERGVCEYSVGLTLDVAEISHCAIFPDMKLLCAILIFIC